MIYFIDFENVHLNGLVGIDKLSCEDTVVILFPIGLKQALIKFVTDCTTDATIQFHCISVGYKDALDVKLILKAMLLYKAGNSQMAFISKDHIFAGIKDALQEFNYLGKLTLAVGTACDALTKYYCFDYGVLRIYKKVESIYLNSQHNFIAAPVDTFTLVEEIELHPENNIKVKGIHTIEDRQELWKALDKVNAPEQTSESLGVILKETAPVVDAPVPKYKIPLNENVKRDDAWHELVTYFCFDFLYAIRNECKIYDSKVQVTLLNTLKRVSAKERSIDTMLKLAPGFVGCKGPVMRSCYDKFVKAGGKYAK